MENLIGWLLIVVVPVVIGFGIYKVVKYRKRKQEEREQAELELLEQKAKYMREQYKPKGSTTTVSPQPIKSIPQTSTKAVESTTPAPASDWSNDLLTTMIISDMLNNHKDVSAGTVSWKDDTPTVKETYSKPSTDFGFDDSDSRKSSSSSFSSSDSSSSWFSSDSSSSSSDSGPSSDW
jgi:hypothetical protein